MTKNTTKHNKKEEQKKLIVRIVCIALVVALVVTSLLTMFPSLFQQNDGYSAEELQAMVEAGIVYLAEDGNYYYTEEFLSSITTVESHEGHDHEGHSHDQE